MQSQYERESKKNHYGSEISKLALFRGLRIIILFLHILRPINDPKVWFQPNKFILGSFENGRKSRCHTLLDLWSNETTEILLKLCIKLIPGLVNLEVKNVPKSMKIAKKGKNHTFLYCGNYDKTYLTSSTEWTDPWALSNCLGIYFLKIISFYVLTTRIKPLYPIWLHWSSKDEQLFSPPVKT